MVAIICKYKIHLPHMKQMRRANQGHRDDLD